MIREGVCQGGVGGGKVGLTHVVKWCAKNFACLSIRSVHRGSMT